MNDTLLSVAKPSRHFFEKVTYNHATAEDAEVTCPTRPGNLVISQDETGFGPMANSWGF